MLEAFTDIYQTVRDALMPFVNRFFIAALLLLIGIIVGRILGTFTHKFLHSAELNKTIEKATGSVAPVEQIISHFIRYITYFLFLVMGLNTIGITTTVLTVLAGAVFAIIVLSIILGVKDLLPNAIAGLRIQQQGLVIKGETITVDSIRGRVESVNLTDTQILTPSGDTIIIPNRILVTKEVRKHGKTRKSVKKPKPASTPKKR